MDEGTHRPDPVPLYGCVLTLPVPPHNGKVSVVLTRPPHNKQPSTDG